MAHLSSKQPRAGRDLLDLQGQFSAAAPLCVTVLFLEGQCPSTEGESMTVCYNYSLTKYQVSSWKSKCFYHKIQEIIPTCLSQNSRFSQALQATENKLGYLYIKTGGT